MRISKMQWYALPKDEKKDWQYVSDETGCYFIRKGEVIQQNTNEEAAVDDFERLTKKEETT